jgi:hypothetical protein
MKPARLLLAVTLLAVPAVLIAEDALERYDIDRIQAENSVLGAVRGLWDPPDVSDVLRALPPAERVAAVRELGGFVKEYVQGAEFKKNYAKAWKDAQPKHGSGMSKLDMKSMAGKAEKMAAHDTTAKANANAGLDKDPNVTVRRRLQQFLDETAGIDYDAKTSGSSHAFVDAGYEAKSPLWKMGFRAGREATEAARAFAKEWMEELPTR